nr:hypothetical protein [Bacillus aquiflavi]
MKESLERRELGVKRHLVRRFFLLLGLGLLHATFLWEGDILTLYGSIGLFLLLFINRKKKTILVWGITLFILSPLLLLDFKEIDKKNKVNENIITYIEKSITIYSSGTYSEIYDDRNNSDPLEIDELEYLLLLILTPFIGAPLFLIGMYAAKNKWFHHPKNELPFYRKMMLLLIPSGIILKML